MIRIVKPYPLAHNDPVTAADERPSLHAYQVVLRHVEAGILSGTLRVGDQLPPERDMAGQLGVSRAAVREAMRVLQTQGLITSSTGPGRGTRIAPARGDALARIFQLHLSLSEAGTSDITETRVALERSSAALAAQRATPQDLQRLSALMDAMVSAETIAEFNGLDTDFHVAIARAGKTELVADLTVAVRQAVRDSILRTSRNLPGWEHHRDQLTAEHAAILAAIQSRDPDASATLVEKHIRRAYATLGLAD